MQNQIPKNWQKVKLGEVVEKVIDNRGKTPPLSTSGHPMIEVYQLSRDSKYPDTSDLSKQKYVSDETYNTWFRAGHPQEGDVLVSTVGTISQWGLVPPNSDYCIAQNVVALRPDVSQTTPEYLRSYFNQKSFVGQVNGIAIGATQSSVKLPHFLNLEISLPPLDSQKKVAKVLSAFDDKIEVNNKIAKTLEEMSQALFKEWFVNFKFPGYEKAEFVESELGKIPKGWEVKKIKDAAKINKGISYSSEEIKDNSLGLPMINLANFQRGGGFNPEGIKFFTGRYKITDLVKPGDIIIAMTDLTSNREVIGHPARIPSYSHWNKMLISLDVCAVDTEKLYMEFLYYLMLRKEFSYLMASSAGGTNVAHLSKSVIENYSFVLPERNLIKEFQDFIRPIFSQINKVEMENQKLAALRNLLLPKLMKGEIRV